MKRYNLYAAQPIGGGKATLEAFESASGKWVPYEEVERFAKLIDDLYPMIAGRVIQLNQAGEKQAALQWLDICQRMLEIKEAK